MNDELIVETINRELSLLTIQLVTIEENLTQQTWPWLTERHNAFMSFAMEANRLLSQRENVPPPDVIP